MNFLISIARTSVTICFLLISISCSKQNSLVIKEDTSPAPHVVFVMGDEEYRSEESMPMLAKILKRELGARISLCYPLDAYGIIDPNRNDHIEGLEALQDADLMVMFTRWRALPDTQLHLIDRFVHSGKPIVGFRTSTHAFLYKDDRSKEHYNDEWPTRIFGQQWITHHGHFDDGKNPLTQVNLAPKAESSPILNGVEAFEAYSWLYHVQGGGWHLYDDPDILLTGTSLKSGHAMKDQTDDYPLTNPVAWTKSFEGARVFFTTLGHPYDFLNENMRRLALNGIYWALNMENKIPPKGINVQLEAAYEPNNSGFGKKYKPNMLPVRLD